MNARRKGMARLFRAAAAGVLAAALGWALWPSPVAIQVARVTRGPLTATVESEARTLVRQHYVISAPVDGELQRIDLQPGTAVGTETVVAQIRPIASRPLDARSRAEAVAAVAAAQAAVTRADAAQSEASVALDHADSLLAQSKRLAASAATPASQAEHAGHEMQIRRRALDQAVAAARQARAELARATAVLSPGKPEGELVMLTAPAAGQILRVLRESGGPVVAGTPLVEIGDVGKLEIVAELLSEDAALVRPGAATSVSGWNGKRTVPARVRRVDPAAFTKVSALGLQEQRVRVILDFIESPPPGVGHEYRVDVAIVVWQGQDVLRVPSTALFRSGDGWAVFVLRNGRARLAPIEVGPANPTWTAVERGLAQGDTVVTQPSDQVQDGTRVRPE